MSEDGSGGLPEAVPAFRAHFTDPVYDDQGEEFAPFGHDEGWDLLMDWRDRRDELGPTTRIADILETTEDEVEQMLANFRTGHIDFLEEAYYIQAAGFAVLRLTGRIDEDDRKRTIEAVEAIAEGEEIEVLAIQRRDLLAWRNPA